MALFEPFLTLFGPFKSLFKPFLEQKFIESCLEPYRFYRFEVNLSNRFNQASIKTIPMSLQNDKVHLSPSAGHWSHVTPS